MKGLERIVPYDILKLFTHQELGIYLAGMPEIDGTFVLILVSEMKKSAKYEGHRE